MKCVDLNCDLGESFGNYKMGDDDKIIPLITSANIACGYHGGDPIVMNKTVKLAKDNKVKIGAHPGFPDLMGFGRRNISCSMEEAKAYIIYQIAALDGFCKVNGVNLVHVKPHGALYNMAAKDVNLARAICQGIYEYNKNLTVMGLSGSYLISCAKELGLKTASEVFADRAYEEDGSLVNRSKPNAMITDEDEAISRVLSMVKYNKVKSVTGKEIPIEADTICVHGDGEKALLFVQKIRDAFLKENIKIM